MRLWPFLIFTAFLTGVLYPITGSWEWGTGWLDQMGFSDFAGSTLVHSVGGWAALAGAIILGPRFGKYRKDGSINPIPGHNMSLATIGCFILWLGWFGFNPGSTMAADPGAIAHIAVTTNSAAAAGILGATILSWIRIGKPDLGMTLNGCLAGLVAITAPCAFVSVGSALLIGFIAGFIVVEAVMRFDRIKIDDPVGAISVHLINGIWGTLAVPITNSDASFGGQIVGIIAIGLFVSIASAIVWMLLKVTVGVRASEEDEDLGLDRAELGMEAYPEFGRGSQFS